MFAVHLDGDLGGDGQQTVGLVQDRGGNELTSSGLLNDQFFLIAA